MHFALLLCLGIKIRQLVIVYGACFCRIAGAFVCLLLIESVADAQHFRFQEEKHSYNEAMRKNHSNKVCRV